MNKKSLMISLILVLLISIFVLAEELTTEVSNFQDLFDDGSINTTLWTTAGIIGDISVTESSGVISMYGDPDGASNQGALRIVGQYLNFSKDFEATINLSIPTVSIVGSNVTVSSVRIVNNADILFWGCNYIALDSNSTDFNIQTQGPPLMNGDDIGLSDDPATFSFKYDATTKVLNCTITNEYGSTSVNTTLPDYSSWGNLTLGMYSQVVLSNNDPGDGAFYVQWYDFNITSTEVFGGEGEEDEAGVPEFSDYAIMLLLVLAVGGFVVMRNREE